jgi:hypothetical protein
MRIDVDPATERDLRAYCEAAGVAVERVAEEALRRELRDLLARGGEELRARYRRKGGVGLLPPTEEPEARCGSCGHPESDHASWDDDGAECHPGPCVHVDFGGSCSCPSFEPTSGRERDPVREPWGPAR